MMVLLLNEYGLDIDITEDEKFDFVIDIASGKKKFDDIKEWLEINIVSESK